MQGNEPLPADGDNESFLPPNPVPASSWTNKILKIGFGSDFTIKWSSSTKTNCKIILIVLQILLCFLLFLKLTYVNFNSFDKYQNDTLETRLFQIVRAADDFNETTSEENKNNVKDVPIEYFPAYECDHVAAKFEDEYAEKSKNISEQANICLTIHFQQNTSWTFTNMTVKTNQVKEIVLVGCVEMFQLSVLLDKFNYAYKITFGQTHEIFCESNTIHKVQGDSRRASRTKISLLNLTEIVIQNIDCARIFEFLSKTFYMNAVKSLKIKNIDIDYTNVLGIRLLLKQFKYSLEILHFTDVVWKVPLYDSSSYAVPNLKELEIDFLSPRNANIDFLGGFKAAEHLSKIASTQGYLPYSQYLSVFDYKMIQHVTLGVDISDSVTSLDKLFPINLLPKLDYMELFLNFSELSKCDLLLDYDFRRSYDTKLHSNCDNNF